MVEASYLKTCAAGSMEDILSDRTESPGRHLSATVQSSKNLRRSRRCCILDRSTGAAQHRDETHKKQYKTGATRGMESCVDQFVSVVARQLPGIIEVAASRTNVLQNDIALRYNAILHCREHRH